MVMVMNKKGFTLIETLLVIALTAILLLILVPNVYTLIKTNDVKSCNNLKGSIESAAKIYVTENKYELKFDEKSTQEVTIEKLIETGALKLDSDELINPIDNTEISRDTVIYVNYDKETDTFSYSVNNIKCSDDDKEIYYITYNANGGTGGPSRQIKIQGEDLTLSSDEPSKEGDRFVWWNTKLDGSGTSYKPGDKYNSDENLDLYAQWKTQTYTITYDANGGENDPGEQRENYGTSLTISSGPTRVGYTFTGWNTKSDGNGKDYNSGDTYGENKDVTLYAQWEINKIYIKYNVNGGQVSESTTGSDGTKYNWNTNDEGIIIKEEKDILQVVDYDSELTADGLLNWDNSNYMYITNEGHTAKNGEEWICNSDNCIKERYDDSTSYKASELCDASQGDCTIELGVNWELLRHSLTISSGKGGSITVENITRGGTHIVKSSVTHKTSFYHGDELKVTTDADEGYSLDKLTHGNNEISDGYEFRVTGDSSLNAQWKINEYTITYNGNVQEGQNVSGIPDKQTKKYNVNINLSSDIPTRIGYTFMGWNTKSDGTGISYKSGAEYIDNENITLYAQWEISEYTLTINSAIGGSITVLNTTGGNSVTVSGGGSTTLTVYHGDIVKVTATASSNYELLSLKHGSTSMSSGGTFTVTGAQTVAATWNDYPTAPSLTTIYDLWGSRKYGYNTGGYSVVGDETGIWTTADDPYITFGDDVGADFSGIHGSFVELNNLSSDITIQTFYNSSGAEFSDTYYTDKAVSVGDGYDLSGVTRLVIPFAHTDKTWTKVRYDIGTTSGVSYKINHLGVLADANQWNRDSVTVLAETTDAIGSSYDLQYTYSANATETGTDKNTQWANLISNNEKSTTTLFWNTNINQLMYFRMCDNYGLCSSKTSTYIRIDNTLPTSTITAKDATTATLSYSDNYGVVGYYWGKDNPSNTTVIYTDITTATSGSLTKIVGSAGTYYFAVKDVAGNVSEVKSINVYTVNYDANGGTGAPASQIKLHGGDLTLSSDIPKREGYTFVGWSTDKNASNYTWKAGDNYTINDSKTLYAIWSYTIKYYKNLNYIDNQYALLATLDGVNFNKTNSGGALVGYFYNGYVYEFSGYNDRYTGIVLLSENREAVSYYTSGSGTNDFEILGQIMDNYKTYYYSSAWKAGDLKDTSGLVRTYENYPDSGQATFDETLNLFIKNILLKKELYNEVTVIGNGNVILDTAPDITREGYTFVGWSTTPTGSVLYDTTNNKVSDIGNTELYAIWKAKTLTITYNINGGTGASPATQTFTYGVANNRFGYKVDGSLECQWGNCNSADKDKFGVWYRTGYEFLGWNRDPDATTAQYGTYAEVGNYWIDTYSSEGVHLYAIWKKKS